MNVELEVGCNSNITEAKSNFDFDLAKRFRDGIGCERGVGSRAQHQLNTEAVSNFDFDLANRFLDRIACKRRVGSRT